MNINNISVNKYPISQMFDPDSKIVFEIPKYQREYVWTVREWEALYDDLIENDEGYFLGSVISINIASDSINEPKFEIVDGQQRLTTLSLFFAALYHTLNENKELLDEEQQVDILQLKRKIVPKKTQSITRVVPQVQNSNREDYLGLLSELKIIPDHQKPKNAGNRRIYKAYNFFLDRIEKALAESDDKIASLFKILDKVNTAILVMIEVSNHSDAYTLFESLNDRGAPLTSVDLIKNLLLARLDAKNDGNIDYYFKRWTDILANLGESSTDQDRFFRQNYNAFRHELNGPFMPSDRQFPLGSIATRSTVLPIYEKIITKDPVTALDTLTQNSLIYANIILNKTEGLNPILRNGYQDLQRVQGAPSYLLLLYLIKNSSSLSLDDTEIGRVCNLLVKFFIRRNLTDTPPTRDLSRLFMDFIDKVHKNNYSGLVIYDQLRQTLKQISAPDDIFEQRLRGPVFNTNSGMTRFILCMLAKRDMTVENEIDLWRKTEKDKYVWTIEHIFPQGENIPDKWVQMIANGDKEKASEYQALYVHTFGNLTITGYNSTLSNKPFADKKERKDEKGRYIGYRNGLNLNADVCDKDEWTIEIIQERTNRMVKQILEMSNF